MRNLLRTLSLTLALLPGCGPFGVLGDGDKVTESRRVEPFERLENRSELEVHVERGSSEHVAVTLDWNLQPHVDVSVRNGTLVIDTLRTLDFSGVGRVDVAVPTLTSAHVEGSGDLIARSPSAERIDTDIEVSGSGRVEIWGGLRSVDITVSGSGDVSIGEGDFEHVSIRSSGSGFVEIDGESPRLDVEVSGSGDIDARGLRAIDATFVSSGSSHITSTIDGIARVSLFGSGDIDLWGDHRLELIEKNGSGVVTRH